MLTIIDNQLIAVTPHRQVTVCQLTDQDRANATAKFYGCSLSTAFATITNALPLGKLLTQKGN